MHPRHSTVLIWFNMPCLPMLSSPRKPPPKMFFPSGSFLLTHLQMTKSLGEYLMFGERLRMLVNKLKVVNNNVGGQNFNCRKQLKKDEKRNTAKIKSIAETRDFSGFMRALRIWTRDLQIFSLTLSQLSYLGNTLLTLNYHLFRSFYMSFIKTKKTSSYLILLTK